MGIDRDWIDRLWGLEAATLRAWGSDLPNTYFFSYFLGALLASFFLPPTNHIRHGPASITLPIELAPLRAERVVNSRPEPKHESYEIIRD